MVKIHEFSGSRERRSTRKGFALLAIIVTAILVLGAASFVSFEPFQASTLSHANAAIHGAASVDTAPPPTDPTASGKRQREFDYFPDRYRNQATEPAEPMATF
jgi:hypothetical protein